MAQAERRAVQKALREARIDRSWPMNQDGEDPNSLCRRLRPVGLRVRSCDTSNSGLATCSKLFNHARP